MTTKDIIRENLRFIQKATGMRHKELSGQLNLKERTWASYLEGRAKPPIEVLISISDKFKVDMNDLLRSKLEDSYLFKSVNFFSKKQL